MKDWKRALLVLALLAGVTVLAGGLLGCGCAVILRSLVQP